jgi:broad specificity phosphatase PhoE
MLTWRGHSSVRPSRTGFTPTPCQETRSSTLSGGDRVELVGMTAIYLLRHGTADLDLVQRRRWPGSMADLAPLTPQGIEEATAAAARLAVLGAAALVTSPFTRAMQTACIASCALGLPIQVEFDLHDWVPDDTFAWHPLTEIVTLLSDFDACRGEWPDGQRRSWEPLSAVRARAAAALRAALGRMSNSDALIAVTHQMVIRALTGEGDVGTGQFRQIDSTALTQIATA